MNSRSKPAEARKRTDGTIHRSPVLDLKSMDDGIALLSRYWQQLADMESTLETAEFVLPSSSSTMDESVD